MDFFGNVWENEAKKSFDWFLVFLTIISHDNNFLLFFIFIIELTREQSNISLVEPRKKKRIDTNTKKK